MMFRKEMMIKKFMITDTIDNDDYNWFPYFIVSNVIITTETSNTTII